MVKNQVAIYGKKYKYDSDSDDDLALEKSSWKKAVNSTGVVALKKIERDARQLREDREDLRAAAKRLADLYEQLATGRLERLQAYKKTKKEFDRKQEKDKDANAKWLRSIQTKIASEKTVANGNITDKTLKDEFKKITDALETNHDLAAASSPYTYGSAKEDAAYKEAGLNLQP